MDLEGINWERRLSTRASLREFGEVYFPDIFNKPLAEDHYRVISTSEEVIRYGGQFALAMPRAGGKTAWMRALTAWASLNAFKEFLFFIGSNNDKAKQSLEFLKTVLTYSPKLRQDFPEICLAFKHLEGKAIRSRGQHYRGIQTHIVYGAEDIRYPCLIMEGHEAEVYRKHLGESFLIKVDPDMAPDHEEPWITKNAGSIVRSVGIDGAIRGDAETHPVRLFMPRPDFVMLDDVQKDANAESPTVCEKMIRVIDGAVGGLAGPGETLSSVMPCTVIQQGDVSDTYLNRELKPEWRGDRCSMVTSWPAGITDHGMSLDSPEGLLWNEYREKWVIGMRDEGHHEKATQFYRENREVMDKGFMTSWPERYKADPDKNGPNVELSAQQHAMNLRFKSPDTFPAEYQNNPRPKITLEGVVITPEQLCQRTIPIQRGQALYDSQVVVAHIDVQNEGFFYTICALSLDFTGIVSEYGVWPPVPSSNFTKAQLGNWKLLTKEFLTEYPNLKTRASFTEKVSGKGRRDAPFEAKIYFGLQKVVGMLLAKKLYRDNTSPLSINAIGIDSRWGRSTDIIKRFVQNLNRPDVVRTQGFAIPPQQKQLEEYTRTPGWLFEDQIHTDLKEVKWVWRTGQDMLYYLQMDVNRLKTFLMSRLASPMGTPGSICLHEGEHHMFSMHVCGSEYPEQMAAKGLEKDMWTERDGKPDNDYLDNLVGCMALASSKGCKITNQETGLASLTPVRKRKTLKEQWADKQKASRR